MQIQKIAYCSNSDFEYAYRLRDGVQMCMVLWYGLVKYRSKRSENEIHVRAQWVRALFPLDTVQRGGSDNPTSS